MADGLVVRLHDPWADAPEGWAEFSAKERLTMVWSWPLVRAAAVGGRTAIIAGTVRSGSNVVGLVTGRLPGLRIGPSRFPLAGVADIDCLVSASLPGIVLAADADADA